MENDHYLKKELYQLIKSDERIFDFIQDSVLDGMWYWDIENPENEWMNSKFWTVLGYDPKEMPHKSSAWQGLINQDDLKVALENFTKHCENPNHPYDQIVRYTHKNGSTVWIRCRGMAIRDEHGKPVRMLGAHHEITDLKNAEIELKKAKEKAEESEKRISSIIENTQAGYFYIDIHGIFQNVNKAWLDIYKFQDFDEIIGKHFSTIIQINQLEKVNQAFEEIRKGNPVFMNGTFSRQHKDNTIGYHTFSAHPVFINNSVEGFEGFIIDITAQKEIELSLKRSQALLSDAEISTGIGCWDWDVVNDIAYWSEGLFNIFKRNPAEGAPSWDQHHEFYVKEDFEEYKKVVAGCLNSGLPYQFELRAVCADGEIKHCIARGHAEKNSENVINRLWGTLQDITLQKNFEKELITSKERAEESDRLKSAFLANMSHEVRTPLNSIIGFSELLGDPDFSDNQKAEFIHIIVMNGNNLLNIISDIVDISRIEAGEINIRKTAVNVCELLEKMKMQHFIQRTEKPIEFRWIYPADENENLIVLADKERLSQVLINLLSNAIKFTSKGYIEIACRPLNGFVEFSIKDTGIGISAAFHKQIFERFRQGEESYTRKFGGNGLGLAISKNLIELMGGQIWVESEVGKGSTFYFTLPYNTEGKK